MRGYRAAVLYGQRFLPRRPLKGPLMIPPKIRQAAVLAATSTTVVALLAAGGLAVADGAAAQAPTPSYVLRASYHGDLSFSSRATTVKVQCYGASQDDPNCHAEGTFTITVTAAAKQRLGLSSATVGKGVLKACGLAQSCGRELTIPAAVKPKLKAFFDKAQDKCGHCGHASPVAGRISVTLTGPAGLPDGRLSDSVVVGIGTISGLGRKGWASVCSSNWYGSCELSSGQRPAPGATPTD